jgi:hypothetical protein
MRRGREKLCYLLMLMLEKSGEGRLDEKMGDVPVCMDTKHDHAL